MKLVKFQLPAHLTPKYAALTVTFLAAAALSACGGGDDMLSPVVVLPVVTNSVQSMGVGTVSAIVSKYELQADDKYFVPYEGSNIATKAEFPKGFLPSYGSALAFKARRPDGTLEFYGLTDRGPNGDGPRVPAIAPATGQSDAKFFPAPSFTPSIGVITVGPGGAVLQSSQPILFSAALKSSGLSLAPGKVGSSGEVPLSDGARFDTAKANFSDQGIDTEGIAVDAARGVLWVSDEYGPFIMRINPATGVIEKRYQPGAGAADLPAVLARRRANRGLEGLSLDVGTGRLHTFLQSPLSDSQATGTLTASFTGSSVCNTDAGAGKRIERFARFTRWVEFDPTTEASRMFAYPLDCNDWADGRTGNAKLGDAVSLGNGKFIVIEQGSAATGKVINRLMLIEVGNATNIAAAAFNPTTSDLEKSSMSGNAVNGALYTTVVTLKKTLLFDLNAIGWVAEKAEGLALVDDNTLALTNDNDFGLKTVVQSSTGVAIAGADVTACSVDALGNFITGTAVGCTLGNTARLGQGAADERPNRFWLIKFDKKLSAY